MTDDFFAFDDYIKNAADMAMHKIESRLRITEEISEYNQKKVLASFIKNNVSESLFSTSTGYGYGDRGRDVLDSVCADIFCAEDALIRHNFTCGTHTLAVALYGMLRPGDKMLSVTGTPYDTIHSVIGINGKGDGSLKDFGVEYMQVDLKNNKPDYDNIEKFLKNNKVKLVYIQRSRGYSLRPSLSCDEISKIVKIVKDNSDADVMVDNCYGEFTEKKEPIEAGADVIAGSLIKNVGGGIARTGGYIAGRKNLIEKISYRMTTPGLGREVGATLGMNRELFMGLFFAPHTVSEALKTAYFTAALFETFGFSASPSSSDERHDIVQCLLLNNEKNLISFCQGLQSGAPIDSFVTPEPWDMPGYDNKVIMAAGAFTGGASIELSADAPLREPFAVWLQGGLNFYSAKIGVMKAAQNMYEKGYLKNEI